jgi:HSP20 family protein
MANLIRRDNKELAQTRGAERRPDANRTWDPFQMMDALMRWDPFRELESPWRGQGSSFLPRFDVKETRDGYLFRADLPGVKESDLDISVTGNILTISGKREDEQREEGEQYHAWERSHGEFTRSFSLPDGVDLETVNADLEDGVLTVRVGKKPEVQARKISIGTPRADQS